ncbi:MAG: hypothetical protein JXR73_16670 [Candidatus Omnitrophica bacterium]|nr:hypothetical protein [Candidatus Omnitrophota bacterium]
MSSRIKQNCFCRILLNFLFFTAFGLHCVADGSILDSSDFNDIAGPVKSVRFEESWYVNQDGKRAPDERHLSSVCTFTPEGDLKERIFYDAEGNIKDRWIHEFDDRRRITTEAKYTTGGQLITKVEYVYKEGKRSEKLIYRYDGSLEKRLKYKYNEKGQLIEADMFSPDQFKRKTLYSYDDRGNRTSFADYNADSDLEVKEEFYFNEKGKLIQSAVFNNENELMATMTYFYDDRGRRTEVMAHIKGGRLEMRRLYEHNDRGSVTGLTSYGRDGKFFDREVYSYEYDRYGNWIVKHESTARPDTEYQLPIRIVYRTISYFDDPSE